MRKALEREAGFRIHEFAKKNGVTVRTLHYYDRVGLLKPRRTRHGYRVYRETDTARLEEIAVFKFLGFSLADIKTGLGSNSRRAELMKLQRHSINHKRQLLTISLDMLDELERRSGHDVRALAESVRELEVESDPEASWRKRRLNDARRKIAERRMAWNASLSDYELNRDVRAAIARGDTPDTPAGQVLVARWRDSIERFTGGDAQLEEALELVIRDRSNHTSRADGGGFHEYFFRALQHAS